MTRHDFDESGVDLDGLRYWRCTCGWQTPLVSTVQEAAEELKAHLDDVTDSMIVLPPGEDVIELHDDDENRSSSRRSGTTPERE